MVRFLAVFPEIAHFIRVKLILRLLIIICLPLVCAPSILKAQTDTLQKRILIKGQLRDENDQPISNAIIINKRTKTGAFGNADGSFKINCDRSDTLAITSLGFHSRNVTYTDSSGKSEFNLILYLDTRIYKTATVEIFAPRDLEKIQEDINKLGYDESDYRLSGINAVQSPITFLYQEFSKKERSKRQVAYLENEDKKRDLLKELFRLYVDYQIIELNNEEFDDFITYLNVSDDFLINSSQYDFLVYVKEKFRDYRVYMRQQKQMKSSDFDYDKD